MMWRYKNVVEFFILLCYIAITHIQGGSSMNEKLHKQNSLIDLMPKDLTVYQRKGLNGLLKKALWGIKTNPDFDQAKDFFYISYTEIKKIIASTQTDKRVFDYLNSLLNAKVNYYTGHIKGGFTILQAFEDDSTNIKFQVSNHVYNRLCETDYTTLDLGEMANLTKKHAVTLYEWFLRYRDFKPNGEYYDPKWPLKEFRNRIGANGKSYELIKLLKQKVIEPAIKDINDNTSLKVSYKLTKEGGRKYTHIQLFLERPQIIEAETVEKILICDNTQEVIDKILQTDLIHIKEKRVNRQQLEGAIKELNKQHNKSDLILATLKKLVKDNKKTIHPENLKAYLWSVAIGSDNEKVPEKSLKPKPEKVETKQLEVPIDELNDLGVITPEELELARALYLQETNTPKFDEVHEKIFSSIKGQYIRKARLLQEKEKNNKKNDDNIPPSGTIKPLNPEMKKDSMNREFPEEFNSWEDYQEYLNKTWYEENPDIALKESKRLKKEENNIKGIENFIYEINLKRDELNSMMKFSSSITRRALQVKVDYINNLYTTFSQLTFDMEHHPHKLSLESIKTLEEVTTKLEEIIGKKLELEESLEDQSINKIADCPSTFSKIEKEIDSLLELSDIPQEKLLSKKGKKLFGGALISRLESIAKELKTKIKYKDKVIG